MSRRLSVVIMAVGLASGALAHTGVKNPTVMARMHSMKSIGAEMKLLGDMAKGQTGFDAAAAQAAAEAIASHAADTADLFRDPEDDPKSEAKPEIWTEFEEFTAISDRLETAARKASADIQTPADLQTALGSMGQTCRSCHRAYRE